MTAAARDEAEVRKLRTEAESLRAAATAARSDQRKYRLIARAVVNERNADRLAAALSESSHVE